MNKAVCLYTT